MRIKTLQWFKIPRIVRIPKVSGAIYKIITKLQMNTLEKLTLTEIGINQKVRDKQVTVTLTTYADRVNTVHYTIRTLLNQTYKPDRVILWLADEFRDAELPKELLELEKFGLTIRYCEELRSHKKYYFAMQEFPEDIIITADDDIIYPENQIEKLIKVSGRFPGCVVANEAKKLVFDKKFELLYQQNEGSASFGMTPDVMLLPIGCGCILYPPHCLDKEVFNKENIKGLAYTADDLWLKAMEIRNGVKAVKTAKWIRTLSCIEGSQKTHLAQVNRLENKNEETMRKILDAYPDIKEIISNNREQ